MEAAERARWRGMSLRTRFLLAMSVMLVPLLNLAVTSWRWMAAFDDAARAAGPGGSPADLARAAAVHRVHEQGRVAIFFALVTGAAVAVVAGRLLARSVLRPLSAIRLGAERLGGGDLAYRLRLSRRDELGLVATAFDAMADELETAHRDLAHSATQDPLTGLANRRLLQQQLAERAAGPGPWAVLLLDLDDFKGLNDSLGHGVGDEVLRVLATRLARAVPAPGVCARLGGDEFAVLLPDAPAVEACRVAEELVREMSRPVPAAGRDVVLGASIGIAVPTGGRGSAPLEALRDADLAMYAAKRAGGGRAELFVPAMHERAVARLGLEAELRGALERGEVVPHYQPLVDLVSGRLLGLEALARWQHPTRGLLGPAAFIPLAEESELVVTLGQQVLERACAEVQQWRRRHGQEHLRVAVNLSARQLQDPLLPERVRRALADSGLPPDRLTLEITETVMMQDPAGSLERLNALVAQGVVLAIDDFGTGYCSLGYLQRFPIQVLKVDRSFVAPLGTDSDARVLIGAVLRLAQTLSLRVVAEGVETPEQADVLCRLGFDRAQGYLFGRPVPLAEVAVPQAAAVAG